MLSLIRECRQTFLRAIMSSPPAQTQESLHFIVGNMACDADSIISALSLAIVLNGGRKNSNIVPIVACRRIDWHLRREANYLLDEIRKMELSNIHTQTITNTHLWLQTIETAIPSSLVFLDDIEAQASYLSTLASSGKLSFTLVDHNVAWGPFALYPSCVIGIVDHHVDGQQHRHVQGIAREISFDISVGRGIGSTCTLVAYRAMTSGYLHIPLLAKQLAYVLRSVILLDTSNLSIPAGKTTPSDTAAIQLLNSVLGVDSDTNTVAYNELASLRYDVHWWQAMTVEQAVLYDYKKFSYDTSITKGLNILPSTSPKQLNIGIAAFCTHLITYFGDESENMEKKKNNTNVTDEFHMNLSIQRIQELHTLVTQKQAELQAEVLLFVSCCDGMRQLAVWRGESKNRNVVDSIIEALMSNADLRLQKIDTTCKENMSFSSDLVIFNQKNSQLSRKALDPILKDLVAKM